VVAVFEVGERIGVSIGFDGGGFGKFRLVQPEMNVALPGNGEIGSEKLGGQVVAGKDLAFDGRKDDQAGIGGRDGEGKQKKDNGDEPSAHGFIVAVKLGVVKKK